MAPQVQNLDPQRTGSELDLVQSLCLNHLQLPTNHECTTLQKVPRNALLKGLVLQLLLHFLQVKDIYCCRKVQRNVPRSCKWVDNLKIFKTYS